jgi:hypothetical protein
MMPMENENSYQEPRTELFGKIRITSESLINMVGVVLFYVVVFVAFSVFASQV